MSVRIPKFGESTHTNQGIDDVHALPRADRRVIGQHDPDALRKEPARVIREQEWTPADTNALIAEVEAYQQEQDEKSLPGRHAVEALVQEPMPDDAPKRDREALRAAARRVNRFPFGKK